jgi:uncharacterized membrane protein YvbJ
MLKSLNDWVQTVYITGWGLVAMVTLMMAVALFFALYYGIRWYARKKAYFENMEEAVRLVDETTDKASAAVQNHAVECAKILETMIEENNRLRTDLMVSEDNLKVKSNECKRLKGRLGAIDLRFQAAKLTNESLSTEGFPRTPFKDRFEVIHTCLARK